MNLFEDKKKIGELQDKLAKLEAEKNELNLTLHETKNILDHSRDFLYKLNVKTMTLEYMSSGVEAMTGYTAQEHLEMGVEGMQAKLHPDHVQKVIDYRLKMMETIQDSSKSFVFEYLFKCKNGEYKWLSDSHSLYRDNDGNPDYFLGNVRDVTEKKKNEEKLDTYQDYLEDMVDDRTEELEDANKKLHYELQNQIELKKALQQSEYFSKTIISSIAQGIFVLGKDFKYKAWNTRMEEITGYKSDEVLDQNALELFPDFIKDNKFEELALRVFNGETLSSDDIPYSVPKKSKTGWMTGIYSPFYDENQNITGLVGVVTETSDKRDALLALHDSEEKYRNLINTTETGFVVLGGDGIVIEANDIYAQMTGRQKAEDVVGQSVLEWTAEYDLERNEKEVRKCFISGYVRDLEIDYVHPDGKTVTIEINANVIKTKDGVIIQTLCRDISERKLAEEKLKIFQLFTEHSGQGCGWATLDGRVVYSNQKMCEMLSTTPDKLKGTRITKYYPVETIRKIENEIIPQILEGVGWQGELPFISVNGVDFPTLQNMFLIRDSLGKPIYMANVITDISERTELEFRLRQAQKMEAIGQLAGGIAHDFNNQLAGIMGNADLLLMDLEDENQKDCARMIARIAQRSSELTNQLLAFARKGKNLSVPINIHKIIGEAISILEHSIDRKINISQHLNANPHVVDGDPTQIQNVILNIGLNARDAMPEGGYIVFETNTIHIDDDPQLKTGNYIEINVSDNGIGMDDEIITRIFEPFFTTKDYGKGTGMGLAAVYGIINNHFGSIKCSSEIGKGTTFKICLPVSKKYSETNESTSKEQMCLGEGNILVVDDEHIVRETSSLLLNKLGYECKCCKNGEEAVRYYRDNYKNIDVVLLDVIMPEMGGKETFIEMQKINPDVKVILTSGYDINNEVQEILDLGANRFLKKPFKIIKLSSIFAESIK